MPKAFLINYRDCFNCHSCEVACQMFHEYKPQQGGVKVNPVGPWEYEPEKWEFDYVPFFTEQCDMCIAKTERGQLPTCVQHCEGECLKFGELEDMVKELNGKPKQIIQIMDFSE